MASTMLPKMHHLSGKKIAIAGGGLGGLAFALALHKIYPQVTSAPFPELIIYERDSKGNAGSRGGYSLGLRSDAPGGLQALQKLGLLDEMIREATVVSDEKHPDGFMFMDKNFEPVFQAYAKPVPGLPVTNLRVMRDRIRRVLLDAAIEAGCIIRWDSLCSGVRRLENGQLETNFADGESDTCDVLIAADGAGSRIRAQLRPSDTPVFRGVSLLMATARFEKPQPLGRKLGLVKSDDQGGLFVAPVESNSVLWSFNRARDTPVEPKRQPMSESEVKGLLDEARAHSHKFSPLFRELVDRTDPKTVVQINAQDKEPFAHTDPGFPDVVFIGDANHAVSPFAGNGANMALCDGWDLAELLCKSDSTQAAVRKYDEVVVPRATAVWKQSHRNISLFLFSGWKRWLLFSIMRLVSVLFLNRRNAKIEAAADDKEKREIQQVSKEAATQ